MHSRLYQAMLRAYFWLFDQEYSWQCSGDRYVVLEIELASAIGKASGLIPVSIFGLCILYLYFCVLCSQLWGG